MHFSNIVLFIAAAASASPLHARQTDWTITDFLGEHIPHSAFSSTHFNVTSSAFGTAACSFDKATRSANGLAHFLNKPCSGPAGVTFSQSRIKNSDNIWSVWVTYDGSSQYAQSSASYYTTDNGAFEWEKLDFGSSFALQPPLGG